MRNWWNGLVIGLAAMIAVAGQAQKSHAAAACGDLNNDGQVTVADALLLLQVVGNSNPGTTLCGGSGAQQCGDVRNDAPTPQLSTADVVVLLNFLAGNPTLFPLCGASSTAIACPGGTATISGNINSNQTWPNTCEVHVDGTVFVQPNVVVTINPGTTVKGVAGASSPSALVFLRGSKINAAGTPSQPITFTSTNAPGARGIGDWGGVVLNGAAPVNCPGGECLAEGLVGVPFGGNNPDDSSGVLRYARIEFSGIELSPDNELNVFTQNGVGRGTTIDHIQANVGFDDCFEWFGGTVKEKYLVASGCGDDLFDWQLATTGSFQYALGIQKQTFLQAGNGNNGFEGDNNENGFDLLPRSNPSFCNFTMIGTKAQSSPSGGSGALLRRGTAGKVMNTIFENFFTRAVTVNDNATTQQACTGASTLKTTEPFLLLDGLIAFNNGSTGNETIGGSGASPCTTANWWSALVTAGRSIRPTAPNTAGPDPGIDPTYPTAVTGQFFPTGGGPASTGAANCQAFDPGFFESNTYIGAFKPGGTSGDNWMITPGGWINFAQN